MAKIIQLQKAGRITLFLKLKTRKKKYDFRVGSIKDKYGNKKLMISWRLPVIAFVLPSESKKSKEEVLSKYVNDALVPIR